MRLTFDHLVVAAERLEDGVAAIEARLDVSFEAGGKHPRYGTHNALLGLQGGHYLEVIAIDPDAEPEHLPRWFGLDEFGGAPRLITWVCQMRGLGRVALPKGFSGVARLTRGTLSWDMAEAEGGALPFDQCHPGLIDWGDTPHPATRLTPTELSLSKIEITHPKAEGLSAGVGAVEGVRVNVTQGDAWLRACLIAADGREIWL